MPNFVVIRDIHFIIVFLLNDIIDILFHLSNTYILHISATWSGIACGDGGGGGSFLVVKMSLHKYIKPHASSLSIS